MAEKKPWWGIPAWAKKKAGEIVDDLQGYNDPDFAKLKPESGVTSTPVSPTGAAKEAVKKTLDAEKRRRQQRPKAYRRDWMDK